MLIGELTQMHKVAPNFTSEKNKRRTNDHDSYKVSIEKEYDITFISLFKSV